MLERTAAYLEPCGLRVVPPNKNPLRSTRQLHTAFWQHGAAHVELTTAWHALMHGTLDSALVLAGNARSPSLSASAFLLDFLYPTGAVALMRRRLSPSSSDRPDRLRFRSPPSYVSPRLYNSSLPRQQPQPASSAVEGQADAARGDHDVEDDTQVDVSPSSVEFSDPEPPTQIDNRTRAATIERILTTNDLDEADLLWSHYKSLDDRSQHTHFSRVLAFLSRTGRVSDSWKISELFHKLEEPSWDHGIFVASVSAEINLQNHSRALSIFERGLRSVVLDNTALVDALDLLLAAAFKSSTTDLLQKTWKLYPEMAARWDFNGIIADLKHLASVSGIAENALLFPEYIKERLSDSSSNEADREALQVLEKILVRKAMMSCEYTQVIPLLRITKDPLAFEEYLRSAEKRGRRQASIDVYAIYRGLPGCSPSHAALHCVFTAYTKLSSVTKKIAGVELLWDDWHRFHSVPSRRAYQRHLAFHAARGDKERVYSLWTEYVERFRDDPCVNIFDGSEGSDTFAHLLQVHAVNAEPEEAQRIFNDMTNKFKIQSSVYDWNILLNAYVKADDYDGAIDIFDSLCHATEPDKYSFGTLMQMVGSRGDLRFTVELYRRARSSGIYANDAMLSSLIDAYCQNDLFKEAEDVCTRAASKGIIATRMWNKLLYYNALRRDLVSINNILTTMAEKSIPYNRFTYEQLLFGLAVCRQSQHALHLLTVALKENVFEVTSTHFQLVMGSLLRTGEPALIRRLCLLMNENKIPITEDVVFRLSQALGQWKDLPPQQRVQRSEKQWLGSALRSFFQIYGLRTGMSVSSEAPSTSKPAPPRELLRSSRGVYQFSTMMNLFAQLNDRVQVNELIDLYRSAFQGTSNNEGILPLSMLNAVMRLGLQDQQYDRVRSTWRLLFDNTKLEARSADFNADLPYNNRISPKYRYALSGGLRVMQEMLFKEGNVSGLRDLMKEVLDAGFEVDSKNWNYHVQVLAQMQQHKAAFVVCEKVLMPNWTGWSTARTKEAMRNALPLDTRRKGSSPRYLRPTATTLYRLAQAYLELNKQGPWSRDIAATLHEIESECVQVIRAIKSMVRVHSSLEEEIFDSFEFTDSVDVSELGEKINSETEPQRTNQPLEVHEPTM
ncbi:hypothetical protein F4782DRAFT_419430 [Xylaria castorea]|nr:hypothetical protein F4782DRAFT_419430 [Xylaria castorea]